MTVARLRSLSGLAATIVGGSAFASASFGALTPIRPSMVASEPSVSTILANIVPAGETATRIDDSDDQHWTFTSPTLTTAAHYAGTTSTVSYGGGTFTLTNASGKHLSSVAANNPGGADYMVSYEVTGGATPSYLLFFEDGGGDFDFNDLVVKVTGTGGPASVPLPAAASTGLAGLAGLGVLALARRRQAIA